MIYSRMVHVIPPHALWGIVVVIGQPYLLTYGLGIGGGERGSGGWSPSGLQALMTWSMCTPARGSYYLGAWGTCLRGAWAIGL